MFQYVPAQNRSGLLLGAGIASAGRDIGAGLRDAILQHKQNVQDNAAADTTFNLLVPQITKFAQQNPGAGINPDDLAQSIAKYGSSGVSAKKGIVGALAIQYGNAVKNVQDQAVIANQQAQAAERNSEANANVTAGNFLKDYLTAPVGNVPGTNVSDDEQAGGAGGGVSPAAKSIMTQAGIPEDDHDQTYAAFKYAASRMPANADANRVMPKVLDSIAKINALKYGQPTDNAPVNFTEDPVTGTRFATHGKEMQASGTNPDKVSTNMGTAVPVNAPDGSLQGYNVPKGGKSGGFTFQPVKDMTADQKQNIILGHQKEIGSLMNQLPWAAGQTNILNAINEQIGTHQKYIDQLQGRTPSGGAPAGLQTATNPDTGEKMVLKDGQWQPLQ
jgi:hypothetical protein